MYERIGRKKFKIMAMDIESHNDSESIAKQETSCWLGCYIDETSKVEDEKSYFYTIEEFLDRLKMDSTMVRTKNKGRSCANVCVYIYNLSFEWSFILPVLLDRGFTFNPTLDDGNVFNSVSNKSCSSVWEVNMHFDGSNGIVKLRDLAKIFGGGLAEVAKSFNLPTQKGEIDYRLNRLHNHIVTKEEKEYCFKDTKIIVDILEIMHNNQDKDFWNSISMASYAMKNLVRTGFKRTYKPYKMYRLQYPELNEKETAFLREGVEGGITYAPDNWQFKVIENKICHIDAHQMHPSSAYLHLFPYGQGEYFKGPNIPRGRICAVRIRITYDYVKLHSIIKLIGLPMITDKEIVVWSFEIPTMLKCYGNLQYEVIEGYAYKMRPLPWRNFYKNNYMQRLKAKANKDAYNTLRYKLLNNSSYGKLLEKPHNQMYANCINRYGIIDSDVITKDIEDWKTQAKYTYLPVGSCIPAYSRVCLIELALKIGWDKVVYFDTDSIFFIWDKESEAVWNKTNQRDFLGGWGLEEFIDRFQVTAPKRYKTETDGKAVIKAGGINFDDYKYKTNKDMVDKLISEGLTMRDALRQIDLSFDEINLVSSTWKVQRAYRVKGGTIIEFQEKEIQVPKKYQNIYDRNTKDSF